MKWLEAFGAALPRDLAVRVTLPLYVDAVPTGMLHGVLKGVAEALMQCPSGPGSRSERHHMAERISLEANRLHRWQISGKDPET